MSEDSKQYENLLGNIRKLLKERAGQEVIWHFLSLCDIYSISFADGAKMAFNEGKRAVGLEILDLVNQADPEAYPRMILENLKRQRGAENG